MRHSSQTQRSHAYDKGRCDQLTAAAASVAHCPPCGPPADDGDYQMQTIVDHVRKRVGTIGAHPKGTPLFLNYDSKVAHYPLQAPDAYLKDDPAVAAVEDPERRRMVAMVRMMDDAVAQVIAAARDDDNDNDNGSGNDNHDDENNFNDNGPGVHQAGPRRAPREPQESRRQPQATQAAQRGPGTPKKPPGAPGAQTEQFAKENVRET